MWTENPELLHMSEQWITGSPFCPTQLEHGDEEANVV